MRRLLVGLVPVLVVAGCGGDDADSTATTAPVTSATAASSTTAVTTSTTGTAATTSAATTSSAAATTTVSTTAAPSTTEPEPVPVNPFAATEIPAGLAAALAAVGDGWTGLSYTHRSTVPGDRFLDNPAMVPFGVDESAAEARITFFVGDLGLHIQEGGVDAAVLRAALLAAGSAPIVTGAGEVFPIPQAGTGIPQQWFGTDVAAFVDGLLVRAAVEGLPAGDLPDPALLDIVARTATALGAPFDASETLTLLGPVLGAPNFYANVGGRTTPLADYLRVNQRASQAKIQAFREGSGMHLAPSGVLRTAGGLGDGATTMVTMLATPAEATAAAEAYTTIYETGVVDGETWRERHGPATIVAEGRVVVATWGTADRDLYYLGSPTQWSAT